MAKIALDARLINSSTGRYIERLIHYLEQIDTNNMYVIIIPSKDKDYYKPSNPRFSIAISDHPIYSFAEQVGFKNLLDEISPDLVHFCMPQQPILYKGRSVTTIHDLTLLNTYNSDKNWFIYRSKQFVGRFVFKRVARSSRFIITPTEYVKKTVVEFAHIPESKVRVTLEAAEAVHDKPQPYLPMDSKDFIMYVGSQSDYKNAKRLILAHQKLLSSNPELRLVLVGKTTGANGAAAGRNQDWSKAQNHKNVTFTGFLPDDQLAWLYENTRAYVFPSLMEGFGLPGLEAMASGAPVVSSNATCLPEVHGGAAEYFNPLDINDIAQAIERVISDDELRSKLIELGHNQVAKYSWQRMAEQTHQVYLDALSSK
ncbi:glycosyltransferase family 4 protein [Candidatus Saccharibacteria bacterium]|nr:glycosyltransferase family 4 protein [Candidatus Saccharibacteria bacterium]